MGNPQLILGDLPPDAELDEDIIRRDSVTALTFTDKGVYLLPRFGKTDDEEPMYASPQMMIIEKLNTVCDGKDENGNEKELVYQPPFITTPTWLQKGDVNSGIGTFPSFGMVVDKFVIPRMLVPDTLISRNGLFYWGDPAPNIKPENFDTKGGNWKWRVFGNDGTEISWWSPQTGNLAHTGVSQVVDVSSDLDSMLQTKSYNGHATTCKFVLDLTAGDATSYSVDVAAANVMNKMGKKNRLGSFTLYLGNIRPIRDVSAVAVGNQGNQGNQGPITTPKDADAYSVTVNIGKDIVVTFEKNSVMKVKLEGEKGNEQEINIANVATSMSSQKISDYDQGLVGFTFIPVFNGLVVLVGRYLGLTKGKSSLNMHLVEKRPGVDPMQHLAKNHTFDIENQTDVLVEPSVDTPPCLDIGDKLTVQFNNCTGAFGYVPVFFAPEARGAFYFVSGSDAASNTSSVTNYRLLPVWSKNNTASALYPFLYGSTARYPKNYNRYNPVNEIPGAKRVTLKRDFSWPVTQIRGYLEPPDETSGETKGTYLIEFATSQTMSGSSGDLVGVGETVKITGSHAGTYKVVASISGYVTCTNTSNSVFTETPAVVTALMSANPNIKARKIIFGITSGEQVEKNEDEDSDNIATAYLARLTRLAQSNYSRFPPMLWGFLLTTSDSLQQNIDSSNGTLLDIGEDWERYIQSVTVTHNESGTSGSMTLDRYALTQFCDDYDKNILMQKVGALGLDIKFVDTEVDNSAKSYAINLSQRDETTSGDSADNLGETNWEYNQSNLGLLLRGFAYGQGISDSVSANEMTMPLFGIQKKLEEIKIVNAPFFDGRKLVDVLKYLAMYGNVCMNLSNADPETKLPASSSISTALVDFKLGTSVWDALHQVAEITGHTFMLQPDGVLWWYRISNTNGIPRATKGHQVWTYPNLRVVSNTTEPDFSQFYNHIILMALQAPTMNVQNPLEKVDMPTMPLIAGARLKNTNPVIPWSKLLVVPLNSYWKAAELNAEAYRYAKRAQSILWNGTTTIPGNLGIKLFDTFTNSPQQALGTFNLSDDSVMKGEFLVVGITHTLEMTSKSLTTQLQLSMLGNTWFDSAGTPKRLATT